MSKPETPWHSALVLLQYTILGTEIAFAFAGPLSVMVVYRDKGMFDATCLALAWMLVIAHLFAMWSHNKTPRG